MSSSKIIKIVSTGVLARRTVGGSRIGADLGYEGAIEIEEAFPNGLLQHGGSAELGRVSHEKNEPAHVTAAEILSDAREESVRIREEAQREGYREGYEAGCSRGMEEGTAAGRAELANEIDAIKNIVLEAHRNRAEILHSAEEEIVKLAIEIARKVIRQELTTSPVIVTAVVSSAIQKVVDKDIVKVRVNPDDHEIVSKYWLAENDDEVSGTWEIVADKRVKRGGCIVDTRSGLVDAQIETQLAEIAKSFEVLVDSESK